MRKKAISQVISTMLLIVLVVTIAGTILFWSKGITGEAITIHGQNIALVCDEIFFEFSYVDSTLYLINSGNVDIYSIELVMHSGDDSEIKDIKELSSKWPENGLGRGGIFSDNIIFDSTVKKVILVPILRGDTESKKQKEHLCEYEDQIIEIN